MEQLTAEQSQCGKAIERLYTNFKKDSKSRKNLSYLKSKLQKLHHEWAIFESRDIQISKLKETNPNHLYFQEKYYNQVEQVYEAMKNALEVDIQEQEELERKESSSLTSANEEQARRIRSQQATMSSLSRLILTVEQGLGSPRSSAYYQQHLQTMNNYWASISATHQNIMAEENTLNYTEDQYHELEDHYQTLAIKLMEHEQQQIPAKASQPEIKLPKINLPVFTGDYLKWKQFHDLFKQLIHQQPIGLAQKMFYLKANVAGEAARLIQHLEVSESNYITAWEILQERYNNKRLIVSAHLSNFLSLPKISGESSGEMKRLHDVTRESLLALQNLEVDTKNWDPIVLHILIQKLDKETHRLFEQSLKTPREVQELSTFLSFLETRFQMLETLGDKRERITLKAQNRQSSLMTSKKVKTCKFCKARGHQIYKCQSFLQLTVLDREKKIRERKLCVNCLNGEHPLRDCPSRNCFKCNGRHHTLLHNALPFTQGVSKQGNAEMAASSAHTAAQKTPEPIEYVFLATAMLLIFDKDQQQKECRAILDSGSQLNFISEKLAKRLQLNGENHEINIDGIGTSKLKTKKRVNIHIKSKVNDYSTQIEAFVLPEITSYQPMRRFDKNSWPIPANIQLADPEFHIPRKVDVLLGAELYCELMLIGQIKLERQLPTLQNTKLGWIVLGKTAYSQSPGEQFCGISTATLDEHLQRFWTLEETEPNHKHRTPSERKCEEHFNRTVTRNKEGRYIVKLPFAQPASTLGDSKEIAIRRFFSLERRLNKDISLKAQYKAFMQEFRELGHMEEVNPAEIPSAHYFMPHHCVVKPESTTTRLRVVFDASCVTTNNTSLNDILLVGPTIQDDLFTILLRFRIYKYVFTADIVKMYRQILVSEEDRNFQLIVWRDNPEDKLKYYRLKTVVYGTSAAPFLATRCLQSLANEENGRYPLGAMAAMNSFYMDDVMTGSDDLTEATQIRDQLRDLLIRGKFVLRKWCANHPKLLENLPADDLGICVDVTKEGDYSTKTLGLTWFPNTDNFAVKTHLPEVKRTTKRTILADIAHIYDPLGLINPVITTAKIFMQELWVLKLEWDAAVPQELYTKWEDFRKRLNVLNTLTIPRHVLSNSRAIKMELHAFADASEKAYGTAIYIRTIDKDNGITVNLLCAKSRVAPLKKTTVPRLELCAALLAAQLVKRLKESLPLNFSQTYYWTDSAITLAWIKTESSSFKTFVANRVAAIQETTRSQEWQHVTTNQNPADLASRGVSPDHLLKATLWFKGPDFLQQPSSNWPKSTVAMPKDDIEKRQCKSILSTAVAPFSLLDDINHKGSFRRLQHIVGYVKRFVKNLKTSRQKRTLSSVLEVSEKLDALQFIIKEIQKDAFSEELRQLEAKGMVHPSSKLNNLTPFLDNEGIIRVGGRLPAANVPFESKHQVLLPHNNSLVYLLVRQLHEKHLHAGPQALTAIIRQRFWPLQVKKLAQTIVHKCIRCARVKPRSLTQLMGNLPAERVQASRPFTNVGIDFCGPIEIHYKIRGKRASKAYIAVFVCFATRAVHLDLVSDLTTDAFLGSLKRFIARRGRPAKIFCDNATNFVGARNKLRELHEFFYRKESQNKFKDYCTEEQIQWCFIPPRSPHFGGLWEAAVKSAKYHLERVLSSASLTYEELYTVVTEVEAILNSRPLTPIASNPNDIEALTPAHFLIGAPITSMINPNIDEREYSLKRRWELVKSLQQEFWRRWSKEYLQELQVRQKWHQRSEPVKPGTIVLIKEENLPPLKWQLARVIKEYKGSDGLTRVADIQTSKGILRRAITKLCPLPVEVDSPAHLDQELPKGLPAEEVSPTKALNISSPATSLKVTTGASRKQELKGTLLSRKRRHKNQGRFLPINPKWLNNPNATKPSSVRNKYDVTNNADLQPPNKIQRTSSYSEKKLTTLMKYHLMLSVLFTIITPSIAMTNANSIEITPFAHPPGIYFEYIGKMSMATDFWNIIAYYKLDPYLKEAYILNSQFRRLKTTCASLSNYKEYCTVISAQFQRQLNIIEANNDVLMKSHGHSTGSRTRRASPFDFIGTIANKAFGILDNEYAKEMAGTISKIENNEEHLLELIKNQTSIIDSTENVMKRDRQFVDQQFSLISSFLDDLQKEAQQANKIVEETKIMEGFNLLSTYVTLLMVGYQRIQSALIDVVTDCRNGKISPLILTPDQLKQELNLIREHLPTTLNLPGQTDPSELLQLYSLMTAKTRVTTSNIIFHIKLPLLTKEPFEIFHVVPVPMRINQSLIEIQINSEFLAVGLHRDHYYELSPEELSGCFMTITGRYICRQKHVLFHKNSGKSQCELHILNQGSPLTQDCHFKKISRSKTWIQLHNRNSWIYVLDHSYVLNVVCGTTAFQKTLEGEGVLQFKEACVIKQESITISSHHVYTSKTDNSFIPSITIDPEHLSAHLTHQERANNPEIVITRNHSHMIEHLRQSIEVIKKREHLPQKINSTDIHHFSISYIGVAIGLILTSILLAKLYLKRRRVAREATIEIPPEPKARRIHFQLKTTQEREST